MATPEPATAHPATTARFRRAEEAHDIEGVLETLAPDVVVRSPITDRVTFQGRDEVRELLRSVFATIDDISFSLRPEKSILLIQSGQSRCSSASILETKFS